MRIKLTFIPENGLLALPIHYNHLIQGLIYTHLNSDLATWLHEEGFSCQKRKFKLFTFSRLFGRFEIKGKNILYEHKVSLKIASPYTKLLESLAECLVQTEYFYIGAQRCMLESVEVEMERRFESPLLVKMLSPMTVYSTLNGPEGKKKVYYYSPFEPEFSQIIIENLCRKMMAFEKIAMDVPEDAYIRPLKVNTKRNFHIIIFKNFVIKAWSGIYEINMPLPLIKMAYDAGLGSKNSQGFGMWEVIEKEKQLCHKKQFR